MTHTTPGRISRVAAAMILTATMLACWTDGTVHTVNAGTRESPDSELFDESLAQGETTRWTFDAPGSYDCFCRLHSGPGMTGEVLVTED